MKPGEKHLVSLAVVVLALLAMLYVLTGTPEPAHSEPRTHVGDVIAQNPDARVVWRRYPVGGLLLCLPDPAIADRLHVPPCQTIPNGAILLIPTTPDPVTQPDRRKS